MSAPVGAEAIGRVRQLRRKLSAECETFARAIYAVPKATLQAAALKADKGAGRAWPRILAATPTPHLYDPVRRLAAWQLLRPIGPLLDAGDGILGGDTSVMLTCAVLGRVRGCAARIEDPWGVSFNDHALARVFERTSFTADPETVMWDAHRLLLGASEAIVPAIEGEVRWAFPGGPGGFLGTLRTNKSEGGEAPFMLFTAETWVHQDEMRTEQAAQCAAIRFRQAGPTLGEGLLLPGVLRG